MTSNLNVPAGMASSTMDENGTIIPDGRTIEPTESPALHRESEVLYEYEYDSYGNWTQQTQSHSYGPDSPPNIRHRTLTYY